MSLDIRAKHKAELAFFKNVQTIYNACLDECGDIHKSLSKLKTRLGQGREKLATAKWDRLHSALRTGEITRGKKSTPGDWAEMEVRLYKAELRAAASRN
jgi:hypothetical protein